MPIWTYITIVRHTSRKRIVRYVRTHVDIDYKVYEALCVTLICIDAVVCA